MAKKAKNKTQVKTFKSDVSKHTLHIATNSEKKQYMKYDPITRKREKFSLVKK
jgi:hypothetical protein